MKGQFVKVNLEKKAGGSGSGGTSGGTSGGSGGKAGGSGGDSNSADPTTMAQPMQLDKQ